jgi:hypothetical protein
MSIPSPNLAQIAQSSGTPGDKPASQRNLKARAKDQIRNFVLMFVYLWVMFGMLAVHESIVLAQHQIDYRFHGLAIINALVFAKVLLVAEDLRLGHRFDDAPLAYSILVKSFLFGVALICFHVVERVLIGIWNGKPIAQSISEIGVDKLEGIVSLGIISTVALGPFFILREIRRVIGPDKFWSLFFDQRHNET